MKPTFAQQLPHGQSVSIPSGVTGSVAHLLRSQAPEPQVCGDRDGQMTLFPGHLLWGLSGKTMTSG